MKFDKNKIPDVIKATEKGINKALTAGAIIVHGEATVRAPVDTGNMRSSLTYSVEADTAKVGTNVEYAPYVEMGTAKMSAQPYLRPSLDENHAKVKDAMKRILKADIEGAAR